MAFNDPDGRKKALVTLCLVGATVWVLIRLCSSGAGDTIGERIQTVWNDVGKFIFAIALLIVIHFGRDILIRLANRR
ncbi:hypothetical protein B0G81_6782 [Paraburkholderia sp. BL6665CI2N2]|uniref:hypothetical protein n=1 Tax=Paraburkholderia sp. BL6665CI2N2 TaxID=1938806 RepID=UPI001066DB88|nr:hypothetical protein [Paraburkholderia sp. BL6665CI2N2]TDY26272.1 hypothetical protein B0G81_6782 [Paraburkholderia sp. BL6665CI2N2]